MSSTNTNVPGPAHVLKCYFALSALPARSENTFAVLHNHLTYALDVSLLLKRVPIPHNDAWSVGTAFGRT